MNFCGRSLTEAPTKNVGQCPSPSSLHKPHNASQNRTPTKPLLHKPTSLSSRSLSYTSLYSKKIACKRLHSAQSFCYSQNRSFTTQFVQETFVLLVFSVTLLCLRLLSIVLLPDFPLRWQQLVAFSEVAAVRTSSYPAHLWQAIVAYEDRRFFGHCGIDPFGITRAVVSFSARGGGSTITQQLIKNTFLKNERTFLRKVVEMMLALALEKAISKWSILSSYMCKIYWGHGIYGIESASMFYFGKVPSLLSLGESAMLAGIIPAPELRSPFRDPRRGKVYQVRVLKRMVEVGFLDIETALLAGRQSLNLRVDCPEYQDGFLHPLSLSREGPGESVEEKLESVNSLVQEIWDWEIESKIWEAREDMERWATRVRMTSADIFVPNA